MPMRLKKVPFVCLLCVFLASLIVNILQGMRILSLQEEIQALAVAGELKPGTSLDPLPVSDLAGRETSLSFYAQSRPTILYVFRPSCVWCRRNVDLINSLAAQLSNRYAIIGLSLSDSGLAEFVSQSRITFPVYSRLSPAEATKYHLGTTPETIVISPQGKVERDWLGAYDYPTKPFLEKFLSVTLPKLSGRAGT
jgi:peroxiredoxin